MRITVKKINTKPRQYEVIRTTSGGGYQVEKRSPRVIKHGGQF